MVPTIVVINLLLAALLLMVAFHIRQLQGQLREWRLGVAPLLRREGPLLVSVPTAWPDRIQVGRQRWHQLQLARRQLGLLLLYVRLLRPLLPWLTLWTKR